MVIDFMGAEVPLSDEELKVTKAIGDKAGAFELPAFTMKQVKELTGVRDHTMIANLLRRFGYQSIVTRVNLDGSVRVFSFWTNKPGVEELSAREQYEFYARATGEELPMWRKELLSQMHCCKGVFAYDAFTVADLRASVNAGTDVGNLRLTNLLRQHGYRSYLAGRYHMGVVERFKFWTKVNFHELERPKELAAFFDRSSPPDSTGVRQATDSMEWWDVVRQHQRENRGVFAAKAFTLDEFRRIEQVNPSIKDRLLINALREWGYRRHFVRCEDGDYKFWTKEELRGVRTMDDKDVWYCDNSPGL